MKTATITDFRQKLKKHLDEIQNDQDILILSGPKKKDFVVLTLAQFNAMEETAHLLSTPANTERLMRGMSQDKAGKIRGRNVDVVNAFKKKKTKRKLSRSL